MPPPTPSAKRVDPELRDTPEPQATIPLSGPSRSTDEVPTAADVVTGDDTNSDELGETVAETRIVAESGNRTETDTRHSAARPALPAPDSADVRSTVRARVYAVGDTIGGRFEVQQVLGSGGFSKVYRVHDVVEGEERALKLFDSAAGYDAVRREISALRLVDHPNVVKVIWADRTDAGEWYLIMEYVEGELLSDYTNGRDHLRDYEAIDVALDVLDALIAIHPDSERLAEIDRKKSEGDLSSEEYEEWLDINDRALVHRDIKPNNIILTRAGPKLLDFNIASRVGDPVRTISGTPPYQPPDADYTQWDVSTDLFAIGVTLYELICDGEHPYPQSRPTVDAGPRDPRKFRKDLVVGLSDFLLKACSNDRDERFSTAVEMRAALESIRRNC